MLSWPRVDVGKGSTGGAQGVYSQMVSQHRSGTGVDATERLHRSTGGRRGIPSDTPHHSKKHGRAAGPSGCPGLSHGSHPAGALGHPGVPGVTAEGGGGTTPAPRGAHPTGTDPARVRVSPATEARRSAASDPGPRHPTRSHGWDRPARATEDGGSRPASSRSRTDPACQMGRAGDEPPTNEAWCGPASAASRTDPAGANARRY